MQFFLYEIVARIVAIYLCFDCGRDVWHGFVERKTRPCSPDFLDWFNPWSHIVAHRCHADPVLDNNGRPHNYFLFVPRCCDIWVVAPKHLSIADGPSATLAAAAFADPIRFQARHTGPATP